MLLKLLEKPNIQNIVDINILKGGPIMQEDWCMSS
jgi:hypothetical protein